MKKKTIGHGMMLALARVEAEDEHRQKLYADTPKKPMSTRLVRRHEALATMRQMPNKFQRPKIAAIKTAPKPRRKNRPEPGMRLDVDSFDLRLHNWKLEQMKLTGARYGDIIANNNIQSKLYAEFCKEVRG